MVEFVKQFIMMLYFRLSIVFLFFVRIKKISVEFCFNLFYLTPKMSILRQLTSEILRIISWSLYNDIVVFLAPTGCLSPLSTNSTSLSPTHLAVGQLPSIQQFPQIRDPEWLKVEVGYHAMTLFYGFNLTFKIKLREKEIAFVEKIKF